MPTELPIACSLDAAALSVRLGEIAALGARSLMGSEVTGGRALLRFRPGAETRRRLAAIAAAEAECCAFLTLRLHEEPEAIALAIEGPPGAEPVVRELAATFARPVS